MAHIAMLNATRCTVIPSNCSRSQHSRGSLRKVQCIPSPRLALGLHPLPARRQMRIAALGEPEKGGGGIKRENEEEYWQTAAEAKGESPFKDPLALIGIASILLPFVILGVAIASGYLDLSPYQYPHH